MTYLGESGTSYDLEPNPITSGGEGAIHNIIGAKNVLAKLYNSKALASPELCDKIIFLAKMRPDPEILRQIAWPLDVLRDYSGNFVGFIMSRLKIDQELGEVYEYTQWQKPDISCAANIQIAQNICAVIDSIHSAGVVFGDFNPRNIGVAKNGLVAFLDTDSYHIVGGAQEFRCKVAFPGYVAPELLEATEIFTKNTGIKQAYDTMPLPTFTQESDCFALAVHIFKLLMNGYSPFEGLPIAADVASAHRSMGNKAVLEDAYAFKKGYKHASPAVLPMSALPKYISDLFERAFINGRKNPKARPSALEWYEAVTQYQSDLVSCPHNSNHAYYKKLKTCPYCEADERYSKALGLPLPIKNPTGFQKPRLKQRSFRKAPPVHKPKSQALYNFWKSASKNLTDAAIWLHIIGTIAAFAFAFVIVEDLANNGLFLAILLGFVAAQFVVFRLMYKGTLFSRCVLLFLTWLYAIWSVYSTPINLRSEEDLFFLDFPIFVLSLFSEGFFRIVFDSFKLIIEIYGFLSVFGIIGALGGVLAALILFLISLRDAALFIWEQLREYFFIFQNAFSTGKNLTPMLAVVLLPVLALVAVFFFLTPMAFYFVGGMAANLRLTVGTAANLSFGGFPLWYIMAATATEAALPFAIITGAALIFLALILNFNLTAFYRLAYFFIIAFGIALFAPLIKEPNGVFINYASSALNWLLISPVITFLIAHILTNQAAIVLQVSDDDAIKNWLKRMPYLYILVLAIAGNMRNKEILPNLGISFWEEALYAVLIPMLAFALARKIFNSMFSFGDAPKYGNGKTGALALFCVAVVILNIINPFSAEGVYEGSISNSNSSNNQTPPTVAPIIQNEIEFTVDSETARVNGQNRSLEFRAFALEEKIMLPLREVAGMLNADLQWLEETREIFLGFRGRAFIISADDPRIQIIETVTYAPGELVARELGLEFFEGYPYFIFIFFDD